MKAYACKLQAMTQKRNLFILLAIGVVGVGATLAIVHYLNRGPEPEPRPWLEPERIDRFLQSIKASKEKAEEDTLAAIKKDRPRLEAIVRLVEKEELPKDGHGRSFSIPKGELPKALETRVGIGDRQALGEFCETNTLISAHRSKGVLFVRIVISRLGHAGTYSVMHTSKRLNKEEFEQSLSAPAAFDEVEPQWWMLIEWY